MIWRSTVQSEHTCQVQIPPPSFTVMSLQRTFISSTYITLNKNLLNHSKRIKTNWPKNYPVSWPPQKLTIQSCSWTLGHSVTTCRKFSLVLITQQKNNSLAPRSVFFIINWYSEKYQEEGRKLFAFEKWQWVHSKFALAKSIVCNLPVPWPFLLVFLAPNQLAYDTPPAAQLLLVNGQIHT